MSLLSNYRKASTEKLQQALAATQTKFKKDERFWELTVDKAGNGFAIIRFLDRPPVDGDEGSPFVQLYTHAFDGPGGWYIENSLTTVEQNDPVSEYNRKLWDTGIDANRKIASKQKRKLTYISNIVVVKDPAKPENDGKVFLYKYGKKIFDKIYEMQNPREDVLDPTTGEPQQPVNVFDLWEGRNFSLKADKQGDFRSYDGSAFAPISSPVAKNDESIEAILTQTHSLKAEMKFKSYDDLKKRLDKVLGFSGDKPATPSAEKQEVKSDVPAAVQAAVAAATTPTAGAEDDDMSFFQNMAKGDE